MKTLFVSGSHRSGTTWMARMLNAHPQIALSGRELWLFGHPSSIGSNTIKSMEKWLKLPAVRARISSDSARRAAIAKTTRLAVRAALTTAIGDVSGAQVIGDKTPFFYATNADEIYLTFPNAYFLHVIRDPRDVIVSHHFHALRNNNWDFFGDPAHAKATWDRIQNQDSKDIDLLDGKAVEKLALRWKQTQDGARHAKTLFENHYLEIKYENLLGDTPKSMARIFNWLGQLSNPQLASEIAEQFTFENMSGGRAAGQADQTKGVRKGIVGDWQNYFTPQINEIVKSCCGECAAIYDYQLQ